MLTALLLLTPLAAAWGGVDAFDSGAGTVTLTWQGHALRYTRDGVLLASTELPRTALPPPLPPGVLDEAEGGGHHATLYADHLVVAGPTPCTTPWTAPVRYSGGSPSGGAPGDEDQPLGAPRVRLPPSGRVVLGADHAVIQGDTFTVVDLRRCEVVAERRTTPAPETVLPVIVDDELFGVGTDTSGLTVHRWALPDLSPRGGFGTTPSTLLVGPDGSPVPVAVPPFGSSLDLRLGDRVFASVARRPVGNDLLLLGEDGAVHLVDVTGAVLASTPPGTLRRLDSVDVGFHEVWVSDGERVVHLPGGEIRPTPALVAERAAAGKAAATPRRRDDPDRPDALSATPVADRADQVLGLSPNGQVQVRAAGAAVVVTRAGRQLGPPLVRPPRVLPHVGVSDDGAVVVFVGFEGVSAHRTADGAVLWTNPDTANGSPVVGPDWFALDGASDLTFYATEDGHFLGRLDELGVLCTDPTGCSSGEGDPFDAARVRGRAWSAPSPEERPYTPPPGLPYTSAAAPACADPAAALAHLTRFPDVFDAELTRLRRDCPGLDGASETDFATVFDDAPAPPVPPRPQVPFPDPLPVPVRGPEARVPAPPQMETLGATVVVHTAAGRWSTPDARAVGIVGEVAVVRRTSGTYAGLAIPDGAELWEMEAAGHFLDARAGGLVDRAHGSTLLDERTGRPLGQWASTILRVARDGDHTAVVARGSAGSPVWVGRGVFPEADPLPAPQAFVVAQEVLDAGFSGDTLVLAGSVSVDGYRDGHLAWVTDLRERPDHLVTTADRAFVVTRTWTFTLDPATGAVVDIQRTAP